VTGVDTVTALVLTVNVALVAPAPTVTLKGTLAAPLLVVSSTCAPSVSAGPVSVTVPMEDCTPPVTLVGFSVTEERVGSACVTTVSEAVLVTPAYDAEMVTGVDVVTALALTVNIALLAPAGTVTLVGPPATPLSLVSNTCAPPVSAGPLSVTVPVEDCAPPVTLVGFSVSEDRVGWA